MQSVIAARPAGVAKRREPPLRRLARLVALAPVCLVAAPAAAQVVEIRVQNNFSRAPQIDIDDYECKPSPCLSPTPTIAYGMVGEYLVRGNGSVANATVFYRGTTNHKSYGCRFSLTVTKTGGSCDVAQILISPYLTQSGNSPRCSIVQTNVPAFPDCHFQVTFSMSN